MITSTAAQVREAVDEGDWNHGRSRYDFGNPSQQSVEVTTRGSDARLMRVQRCCRKQAGITERDVLPGDNTTARGRGWRRGTVDWEGRS